MKFVYAQPHNNSALCWYVFINDESMDFAKQIVAGSFCRSIRHYCGDEKHATMIDRAIFARASISHEVMLPFRTGWYMNINGGICPNLHSIQLEVDADDWPRTRPLTMNDVHITKWMNGKHYYCTLPGGRSLEWNGQSKWSTREAAVRAAKAFLQQECVLNG